MDKLKDRYIDRDRGTYRLRDGQADRQIDRDRNRARGTYRLRDGQADRQIDRYEIEIEIEGRID